MPPRLLMLINTSRRPVVDESALADALEHAEIAAAGLDVFENEPRVEPRLLQLENVVVTPHIASASTATRRKMCMMAAENALAALDGQRPPNLVNRSAVSRLGVGHEPMNRFAGSLEARVTSERLASRSASELG